MANIYEINGVMHQKGHDYPLINHRRPHNLSLKSLCSYIRKNSKEQETLSLSQERMSKSGKASASIGAPSQPPCWVWWTTAMTRRRPQESQTSQRRLNAFATAAEQLNTESDPVELSRKKKDVRRKHAEQTPEIVAEEVDETGNSSKNQGKAIDVSYGDDSEEEGDPEKTVSEGAEEVEVEDVELLINLKGKHKGKRRKASSPAPKSNPVRKSARMTAASGFKSQTPTTTTPAQASSVKTKMRSTNTEEIVEQRYEIFSSQEIIPERSIDLKTEDTWGYLEIIKKGSLEKTVTGLVGYIPEIVKEFYAALPGETTKRSEVTVSVRGMKFEFSPAVINQFFLDMSPLKGDEIETDETMKEVTSEELADFMTDVD